MPKSKFDNPEDFVRAYMQAQSAGKTIQEFADSVGMTHNAAYLRVMRYQKKGVKLPPMPHKMGRVRVDQLNQLIETLGRKN